MDYQPGVRVVLGYVGTAKSPPSSYAGEGTVALQEAVRGFGPKWELASGAFVVAPAAQSGEVAVGISVSRVPRVFAEPKRLGPKTAWTRGHYVVQGGFVRAPEVGEYGEVASESRIIDAWQTLADDPRIVGLGLELEGTDGPPAYFLVSDDGRTGALTHGQVLWKLGAKYENDAVRTWVHDYGGGEAVRLIGVPYAEVGPEAPIVRLAGDHPSRDEFSKTARAAVEGLLKTPAAWNWELVCEQRDTDLNPTSS